MTEPFGVAFLVNTLSLLFFSAKEAECAGYFYRPPAHTGHELLRSKDYTERLLKISLSTQN